MSRDEEGDEWQKGLRELKLNEANLENSQLRLGFGDNHSPLKILNRLSATSKGGTEEKQPQIRKRSALRRWRTLAYTLYRLVS